MALLGILVTFLGFVISLLSLGVMSSVNGRMVMVLAGLAVSLIGIIGVLNPAYMKNANWRR
jgi:cytochrome c biogenesis protein CcdA